MDNSLGRGGRTPAEIIAPFGTKRIRRRPPAKDSDPARRLTSYFLDRWLDVVMDRTDAYNRVRVVDALGQATGYFRTTFLQPSAGRRYTEIEVRAMIDGFMQAVLLGEARIKDKQTAFMCFTGWWGRQPEVRYDPDRNRKYFEEHR
jgi:hypothetical protein